MTNEWPARLSALVAGLLIASALAFLQVLDSEKELFSCLCALVAISVAALVALVAAPPKAQPDFLCVCGTAAFSSYVILRALTSPVPYAARFDLYCILGGVTLYGLTATAFAESARRIWLVLGLLAFAVVVHVLFSVVQFGLGANFDLLFPFLADVTPNARARGLYVDPDHLAGLLEVLGILGLSITAWSRWPNWARVIFGYLTAICYLGLMLTGSRGGYLSAAASLLLFGILSFVTLRAASLSHVVKFGGGGLALCAGLMLLGWIFIQQNSALLNRVNSIVTPDLTRINLCQAAIEQWKLRPFVGTGSGTYLYYGRQFRSPEMQGDPIDVHNDYLQLLGEYGLVGAAGFLFFFGTHLRRGFKAFYHLGPSRIAAGSSLRSDRLALNIGALSAVAAYVVHSSVDFNFHIPANALLFAIIFAVLANPGQRIETMRHPPIYSKLTLCALAIILLLQCIRLLPGEYFAEEAWQALRDEEPSTAVSQAETGLAYEKENPNIYFYLARALVSLGSNEERIPERSRLYQRALDAFDHALHLAPLDGSYALDMARVYDRLGRFQEAETMFTLARERDPRSEAVANLYQVHLELQNPDTTTR